MDFWLVSLNVIIDKVTYWVITVYRSPSGNAHDFVNDFFNWFEVNLIKNCNYNILVVGDFNINWKENNAVKRNLSNKFEDIGFKQFVTDYTRVTNVSKTTIDLVFGNVANVKMWIIII